MVEQGRGRCSGHEGPHIAKHLQGNGPAFRRGCVNLFYSQVGRDKLSLHEQNEGILVYSQVEGQGPGKPLSMITITKASQRTVSRWSQEFASSFNRLPYFYLRTLPDPD